MSYVLIGAAAPPQYYSSASKLKWTSSELKQTHDALKKLDIDWRKLLDKLPVEMLEVFAKGLGAQAKSIVTYPLPIAADFAVLLELTAAGQPIDASTKSLAAFMRDRCLGSAGIMATAGTVSGVLAAAALAGAPVDFGISTGTLAALAGAFAGAATIMAACAAIFDALSKGKSPDQKALVTVVKGGALLAGKTLPDTKVLEQAQKIKTAYDKLRPKPPVEKPAKTTRAPLPSGGRSDSVRRGARESASKISPLLVLGGAAVAGLGVAMVLKRRRKS